METADLVLQFDVEEGHNPDVELVANALLAWVDSLRAAALVLEPEAGLLVELLGVEPGSQRFKQILRRVEAGSQRFHRGGTEYPLIKKQAITLGGMIVAGTIGAGISMALEPDPRIPEDQMVVFREMNDNLRKSVELEAANQRFFRLLYEERSITGVKVYEGGRRGPTYEVGRQNFEILSGLWGGEEMVPKHATRPRMVTWEVTLIKPVLRPEPRRWTFARDGLEFSALMTDPMVLQAIHNRSLRIPFAEGVIMKIEMHFKERFDGQAWRTVNSSRRVRRVLHPLPPPPLAPLFAPSD